MKTLRRIYYRIFKRYKRLQLECVDYATADSMIRANEGKPEREQWDIAEEENYNPCRGVVFLERKERITE